MDRMLLKKIMGKAQMIEYNLRNGQYKNGSYSRDSGDYSHFLSEQIIEMCMEELTKEQEIKIIIETK